MLVGLKTWKEFKRLERIGCNANKKEMEVKVWMKC